MTIDLIQARVLGSLIEKEISTPENYPISMNSLLLACNQRSSREPVMDLAEDQVRQALHGLEEMGMTAPVRESRVTKYEHRARTVLQLRRDETAILCLLLLRGQQTPGELRSRADRLFRFEDSAAVQATLERMGSRGGGNGENAAEGEVSGPLVVMLARQAGSRESRFAHLLSGPVEVGATGAEHRIGTRVEPDKGNTAAPALEAEVERLKDKVAQLEARLERMEAHLPTEEPSRSVE